jgi:molybdenum cofactor synthesis domain-containing protein
MRVGVLTVSTAGAAGERADGSGDVIVAWAARHGYTVADRAIVPDDTGAIVRQLAAWADGGAMDVILTTGGTGLAATDRTPEATRAVLEREAPGIAEYCRAMSWPTFPRAALSRGVAGVRGAVLIVNLPGSPSGVGDHLAALDHVLEHAVALLRGKTAH